jgi:hypothetical protein
MISYLGIGFSRQAVVNYNIPNLFHLVGFALPGKWLQVKDFGDSIAGKYVMAALDALLKPKPLQKLHHAGKGDILRRRRLLEFGREVCSHAPWGIEC